MAGFDSGQIDVTMSTEQIDQLIRTESDADFPDFPEDDVLCNCPSCRAEREELPPGLEQMMEEIGAEAVMHALEEIIGGGLGKRKKSRSRSGGGDRGAHNLDLPF
jgi:hypothetical protein